jgi:hypothetical protein
MRETLKLGPHDSLEIVSSTPEAFEVEASYRSGGSPLPAHLHPAQDERFDVLEGSVRVRVDGDERELREGDEIEIGRGRVHQMWLDGLFREGGDIAEGREVDFAALLEEYADVFRLDR